MARHVNETHGDHWLSGWQVATGVYWIQSRHAFFTNLLRKRESARLVAYSVRHGYLRTYEVKISHKACLNLLRRWRTKFGAAYSELIARNCPVQPPVGGSDASGHG